MSSPKQFHPIALENGVFETQLTRKFAQRKPYKRKDPGIIQAVIPGMIAEISTRAGNHVRQGETLMVLEAMKMLNRIMAPVDGIVKSIHVSVGNKVAKGQVLAEIDPAQ